MQQEDQFFDLERNGAKKKRSSSDPGALGKKEESKQEEESKGEFQASQRVPENSFAIQVEQNYTQKLIAQDHFREDT